MSSAAQYTILSLMTTATFIKIHFHSQYEARVLRSNEMEWLLLPPIAVLPDNGQVDAVWWRTHKKPLQHTAVV